MDVPAPFRMGKAPACSQVFTYIPLTIPGLELFSSMFRKPLAAQAES